MLASQILSVSELTANIKSTLEPAFRSISVKGEISNFKAQSSGHLYFSLKDNQAQISAALFRGNASKLTRTPKNGDQVVAKGEISVYPPRGGYQIIIREVEFLGIGELLIQFQQLKEKLAKRGWFDPTYKKKLPSLPKRIGVITSPTGAVIKDILHVLTRRFSGCQVILSPVKVQGEGAAQEIAQSIFEMNRFDLVDVLIVGRGGGSIEDLWAFNEEIVAQAIFSSRIPIISAVGHETDTTIADWVADLRAPTPSAAAEIAIAEKAHLLQNLEKIKDSTKISLYKLISQYRDKLTSLKIHPLLAQPQSILTFPYQRLDDIKQDLDMRTSSQLAQRQERLTSMKRALQIASPLERLANMRSRLETNKERLLDAIRSILAVKNLAFSEKALATHLASSLTNDLSIKRDRLDRLQKALTSVHPKNLLQKGYAMLFSEKRDSIILSSKELQSNQKFIAVLEDGEILSSALNITETPNGPHL